MKQTIKKSLAIIFAALITSATAAMLTGCGGENKESNSAATTVAATTVAKTTGSNGQSSNANQAQGNQNSQSAESNGSDNGSSQSDDGYIDQQPAIANVKQQAGSGATIISSTKGYAPDGLKAWVIVVQPVTNNDSTDTVTYYSGYQFCYPETASGNNNDSDNSDGSDGYIDEQTRQAQAPPLSVPQRVMLPMA